MTRAAMLLRLQEADDTVASLTAELAAVNAALRGEPELESRQRRSRETEAAGGDAAARVTAAEQELSALEGRTKSLDRRLYDGSVRNPAELVEMQRELDGLRAHVGEVEERLLGLLEGGEAAARESERARDALAEIEARRAEEEAPRRQRLRDLQERLNAAKETRDSTAQALSGTEQALYARVVARHHPAVVSIKGDACGGCHLPLSNEERRAVRAGDQIVQCSNCDRILVP